MSEYTCHTCKTAHTEGNMVAHCAACYSNVQADSLKNLRDACAKGNEATLYKRELSVVQGKLAEAERFLQATGASCELKGCAAIKARLESAERVVKAVRFYVGPTRNSTIWAEAFAGMEDALAAHTKTQGETK